MEKPSFYLLKVQPEVLLKVLYKCQETTTHDYSQCCIIDKIKRPLSYLK